MELWLNTASGLLRFLGFPEHLLASFGRPGEGSMPARTCVKQPGKTCIQPQSNSQARTVPILDVFNLANCVQLICSQQPSVRIKAACKFVPPFERNNCPRNPHCDPSESEGHLLGSQRHATQGHLPFKTHGSASCALASAQDVQQRALAAAGWAHDPREAFWLQDACDLRKTKTID